jgi:hypothetical protein
MAESRGRTPDPVTAPSRRRRPLALLSAVLFLGVLVWLAIGSGTKKAEEPSAPREEATGGSNASAASARAAGPTPHPKPTSSMALAQNAPPSTLAVPNPIRLTNEPSPYPPWCQPLSEGSDPAVGVKEDNPVDTKAGLHVVMGPRKFIVHPPDPMVIDVTVLNQLGAPMDIASGVARFRADGTTAASGPWFEVPLVDDGTGADVAAGDRAYTASFFPSEDEKAAFFKGGEHVMAEVAFEAPRNDGIMRYPLVMTYSREPDATINGKYSDAPSAGGLTISVGVTATQPGTYRVLGSLYSRDGQHAIAIANARATLSQGDGAIPLAFFGKTLHDSGIDGPYDLRFLMLYQQLSEGTEIAGDTVDNAYTTSAYRASSFSSDSYEAPPSDEPVVDMNSPSQQGKPPPLFQDDPHTVNHSTSNPPVTIGRGPATK